MIFHHFCLLIESSWRHSIPGVHHWSRHMYLLHIWQLPFVPSSPLATLCHFAILPHSCVGFWLRSWRGLASEAFVLETWCRALFHSPLAMIQLHLAHLFGYARMSQIALVGPFFRLLHVPMYWNHTKGVIRPCLARNRE